MDDSVWTRTQRVIRVRESARFMEDMGYTDKIDFPSWELEMSIGDVYDQDDE